MVDIIGVDGEEIDSRKRPWCRCCGLDVRHDNFKGPAVRKNGPGEKDKDEILFCQKCNGTKDAKETYSELMAIEKKRIITPVTEPEIVHAKDVDN